MLKESVRSTKLDCLIWSNALRTHIEILIQSTKHEKVNFFKERNPNSAEKEQYFFKLAHSHLHSNYWGVLERN